MMISYIISEEIFYQFFFCSNLHISIDDRKINAFHSTRDSKAELSERVRSRKIDNHDATRSYQHVSREFHDEWKRLFSVPSAVSHILCHDDDDDRGNHKKHKIMYGVIFSLCNLLHSISVTYMCDKYSDFLFHSSAQKNVCLIWVIFNFCKSIWS